MQFHLPLRDSWYHVRTPYCCGEHSITKWVGLLSSLGAGMVSNLLYPWAEVCA